jgi:hypothetical protein
MQADLHDAHFRHLEDAHLLYGQARLANADQLYGLSAECGLKAVMKALSPNFWDPLNDMPTDKKYKRHINDLWERYETYRQGLPVVPQLLLAAANPFDNWDISDRYANRVLFAQLYVDQHKDGAQLVHELIKKAQLEGLL